MTFHNDNYDNKDEGAPFWKIPKEPNINGYPLWSGIPDRHEGNMNPSESLNMIMDIDAAKDIKKQTEYASGMRRDASTGKRDYTLPPRFMLDRVSDVMQLGIDKGYGRDSWQKACTTEELAHFKRSAWRHFLAWQDGDTSEDHYASLIFNLNGAELVKTKLLNQKS